VPSRPRPNHVRSPAPSHHRHHLGELLVLNFFVNKKSYLYDLDSYLYKFLTRTLFVIYSAMVLKSVPVDPRPAYDSDVVYYLYNYFVSFRVYDNYAHQVDIDIFI
jgi:hypothetical protein